jgi:two-component system, chemotaxis family, response regulator PixG
MPVPQPCGVEGDRQLTSNAAVILHHLQRASARTYSGLLSFKAPQVPPWFLVFQLGRLIWATGGEHRVRRWHRLLGSDLHGVATQALSIPSITRTGDDPIWEYKVLGELVQHQGLDRAVVGTIARSALLEILFDMTQFPKALEITETPGPLIEAPIKWMAVNELLDSWQQSWEDWQQAGLTNYSLNLAPVLNEGEQLQTLVSPQTYQNLHHLIRGRLSVRELALRLKQPELTLAKTLVTYENQGLISFRAILDGRDPRHRHLTTVPNNHASPLVVCIDHSPYSSLCLGHMMVAQGYRYEAIEEPEQAIARILEVQPHCIFLAWMLPTGNAQDLCSQLRRLRMFRETPIIVLLENESIVDRIRIKLAGATAVLSKPVKASEIQEILLPHFTSRPEVENSEHLA